MSDPINPNNTSTQNQNPFEKFIKVAEEATVINNDFLNQRNNGSTQQTAQKRKNLRSEYDTLAKVNVKTAYDELMEYEKSLNSFTPEQLALRRQSRAALKKWSESQHKVVRLLERTVIGGGSRKRKTHKRKQRKQRKSRKY